jgi:hypothetical protein
MERRIINAGGFDIEFETIISNVCEKCTYGPVGTPDGKCRCRKIKDPENLENSNSSFFDFCKRKVSLKERPVPGTLDKLIEYSNKVPVKRKFTRSEAVKEYCKNFCFTECVNSCPLYDFKNG